MFVHHAYLCRVTEVKPESIKPFIDSLPVSEVNYITLDNFGIADVRTLTEKAFIRPRVGEKQLLVICLCSITIEAQQALLKLLEEPPTSTAFVFCIPKTLYFIPTLLSRFQLVEFDTETNENNVSEAFTNFLALTIPERVNEIGVRLTAKDIKWVEEIKSGLLSSLKKHSLQTIPETNSTLFWIAEHLQTRGASNKMLLEELALTIKPAAEK